MPQIEHVLFEDPFWLYLALAVAELAIVAMWWSSRSRKLMFALAAPPVLAGAVFLVAALVVTDGEKIDAAAKAIAADIEAGRSEALEQYLSDRFTAQYQSQRLNKAAAIELCGLAKRYLVSTVRIAKSSAITFEGASARMTVLVDLDSGSGIGPPSRRMRMELVWAKGAGGNWTLVRAQEPKFPGLGGT